MPYSADQFDIQFMEDFKKNYTWSIVLDVWPWAWKVQRLIWYDCSSIDCVEVYEPYINQFWLRQKYNTVFLQNIETFTDFRFYDVVVLWDVLEHLEVASAQTLIEKISQHCKAVYVQIPYNCKQWEWEWNPYEEHKQDDLTHEVFMDRYPWFELIARDWQIGLYKKVFNH